MRIKLTIEYDGTKYSGWQKQDGEKTVQGELETAILKVLNFSQDVDVYGAGRTDSGVHATSQVAHFDLSLKNAEIWEKNPLKLTSAINFYLIDKDIVITESLIVPDDFHARFSALMRSYQYIIYNRNVPSVLCKNRAWHVRKKLDEAIMQEGAHFLIGTHNLNAFRSASCNSKNPVKTISLINIKREDDFIFINVTARSFLHNQIRITAGTLKEIGDGTLPKEHMKLLIESQDRKLAGQTAPPHGLYLTGVFY